MGKENRTVLIHSVNVSPLRTVSYRGKEVRTGIFKEPVSGPIFVRHLDLDGDVIADPRYHGGTNKAVYSYPREHYPHWETHLGRTLPHGTFGENLTTSGIMETNVCLGDRYRFGSAILEAVQPRNPCFKLGIKMSDARFIKTFMLSGLSGIYWKVIEEGELAAGSPIELIEKSKDDVTIHDVWAMVHNDQFDPTRALTVVSKYAIGPEWREPLEDELLQKEMTSSP